MTSIVRRSCIEFVASQECLAGIHEDRIDWFLGSIHQEAYVKVLKKEKAQMTFPLKFDSEDTKLNFFSLLHLLNFGSGYRVILKAATHGSGAFDNIIKLLIAAHLSGKTLDAAWMRTVTADEVAEMMRISMIVEIPVPNNPVLHELKPSPASHLVNKIRDALHDTGHTLQKLGEYESLIDFVRDSIRKSANVDALFARMAQLPVLCDKVTLSKKNGGTTEVCIYKKMQVMLSELKRNGLDIPCIQPGDLTIFSDNVIPTMLEHYKLISCPSAETALASDLEISEMQALSVRAASIVVCQSIVKRAEELNMSWIGDEIDLDNYLWKVAKEGDLRNLPRYSDRQTWFY